MKAVKINDFFRFEIKPFIFGAFLSRIMEYNDDKGQKYFYAYSKFKLSKAVFIDDFNLQEYSNELVESFNKYSGYYNWTIHSSSKTGLELRFYIQNDQNISKAMFYKYLYQKVMTSEWVLTDSFNEEKKSFIRGFMELRGSIDTKIKFIAQDYFYDNRLELKKAQILTDLMNLPIYYANFNARDLQPQFVSGLRKRNAQFRINLYFYAACIGFINKYKAQIFENSYYTRGKCQVGSIIYYNVDLPVSRNNEITFIKYLNFFTNNIYEKNLTKDVIQQYRKDLCFDVAVQNKQQRKQSIVSIFSNISEDKCAICGTTKTFINKNTGRQHFEIHHVISYYNNSKDLDNIANLVKLCPNCHDMLKKNRTAKNDQVKAIVKILHEHQEVFEFASSYLSIDDINELADRIWEMLG